MPQDSSGLDGSQNLYLDVKINPKCPESSGHGLDHLSTGWLVPLSVWAGCSQDSFGSLCTEPVQRGTESAKCRVRDLSSLEDPAPHPLSGLYQDGSQRLQGGLCPPPRARLCWGFHANLAFCCHQSWSGLTVRRVKDEVPSTVSESHSISPIRPPLRGVVLT